VDDAARIHIAALAPTIPGNERYLFHAPGIMQANPIALAIREEFPQLKDRVPAPEEGATGSGAQSPDNLVKVDLGKFERVFGSWRFKSARESALETVGDVIANEG
jgi:hypothetical protein